MRYTKTFYQICSNIVKNEDLVLYCHFMLLNATSPSDFFYYSHSY